MAPHIYITSLVSGGAFIMLTAHVFVGVYCINISTDYLFAESKTFNLRAIIIWQVLVSGVYRTLKYLERDERWKLQKMRYML